MAEWAASLRHTNAAATTTTPNKPQAAVTKTPPVARRLAHKENVCPSPMPAVGHHKATKGHDDHLITDSDPPVHLMQLQQERLRIEVEKGFEEITQRANALALQRENIAREEEAIRQRLLAVEQTAVDLDARQAEIETQRDSIEAAYRSADDRRARLLSLERELQHRAEVAERKQHEVAESEEYINARLGLRDEIRALEANVGEQRKQLHRKEEELRQQEQALRERTAQMQRKETDIQELEEWTNARHAQLVRRKEQLASDAERLDNDDKQALLDRIAALEAAAHDAEAFIAELQCSVGAELELVTRVRLAAEAERLRAEQASVRRRDEEASRTVSARVLELEGQVERHAGKEQHLQRCLDAAQAAHAAAAHETAQLLQQNALLQESVQQLEERVAHYELAAAAASGTIACTDDEDEAEDGTSRRSASRRSTKASDSRRSDAMALAELRIDQLQAHLRSREQQLQDAVEQLQRLQASLAAAANSDEEVASLTADLAAARARIAELEHALDQAARASVSVQEEAKSNEEELMRFAAAWEARAQDLAGQVDQLQALVHEMELSRERASHAARPASVEGEAQTDAVPQSSAAATGASLVFTTGPPADKECQFPDPIAPDVGAQRRVVVVPPLPLHGHPPIAPPPAHQQPPLSGGRSNGGPPPLRSSTPTGADPRRVMPPGMGRPPAPIQPDSGRHDPNNTLNTAPGVRSRSNSNSGIIPMRSSTPRAVCRSLTPRFPDGTDATPFGDLDVTEFCMASSDPKLAKLVKKQQKKLEKAMVKDAKKKRRESERKAERANERAAAYQGQGHAVGHPPIVPQQPPPPATAAAAPPAIAPALTAPVTAAPQPVIAPPAAPPAPVIAPDSGRQPHRRADPESLFL